jgi:N-acetylglucosaminyldiphosphoundecaprenol N-acetyl-beta-D-mannosaminyltransferase
MDNKKVRILDVKFDFCTKVEILDTLESRVENNTKTFIVTANPEIVMYANSNSAYSTILNNANYVIADGIGVIIASNILGRPLPERIAGFDLLMELLKVGNQKKWSAYFLGAKTEVIEKAVKNIKVNFPDLNVVGWHDGYFDENTTEITDEIKMKKPDLVFVALGFPKQELWISENAKSLDKGLFMGVGGSFDVLAGEVKRAPIVWQKMNLEWLYRLLKQPSRWKRMLVLPLFIIQVISEKFKKKTNWSDN